MRKSNVADMIGVLQASVLEIAGSAADNKDDLLQKSFAEFEGAMLGDLDPYLPGEPDEEALAKGVSHIALFQDALSKALHGVHLAAAVAPGDQIGEMGRFIAVGELVLRKMANATAEVVEDDADADAAETAGELFKVEDANGEDVLIKSVLPEHLAAYLTDPVILLTEEAEIARSFHEDVIDAARALQKAEALPDVVVTEFPELFEDSSALRKADDETMGAGADPSTGDDPGDMASDDATQNPIETMVRCASVIVMLGGSLLKAGANDQPVDQFGDDVSGVADDSAGMAGPPLRRQEPVLDAPLSKILRGEVEVRDDLADYIENAEHTRSELGVLKKSLDEEKAQNAEMRESLRKMQETVQRLQAAPKAPQGVAMVVNKSDDYVIPGQRPSERQEQLTKLAEVDPDAAAKELLKMVHQGGGQPLTPP